MMHEHNEIDFPCPEDPLTDRLLSTCYNNLIL